jgi:hypothetical protein
MGQDCEVPCLISVILSERDAKAFYEANLVAVADTGCFEFNVAFTAGSCDFGGVFSGGVLEGLEGVKAELDD